MMQTCESLEVAVLLADRFAVIRALSQQLPEQPLQRYWASARGLLDLWGVQLRRCGSELSADWEGAEPIWWQYTPLLEEILMSEMLTRIWNLVLVQCDDRLGIDEYAPIGRSIFAGHLEARSRVLELILRGRQLGIQAVSDVDRTRHAIERWTDLLLASSPAAGEAEQFCFERSRCHDFRRARPVTSGKPFSVVAAAARTTFAKSYQLPCEHARLHHEIHGAILSCLGDELFSESGVMLSSWHARLLSITDDTHVRLQTWLEEPVDTDTDRANPGTLGRF